MQCKAYSKQLFIGHKTALHNCPNPGSLIFPKVTWKLVQHIKNDQIKHKNYSGSTEHIYQTSMTCT